MMRAGDRSSRGARGAPGLCARALYYTWRVCSVVFLHALLVSLVVAYCVAGAVTFQRLEAAHEREVKARVPRLRAAAANALWALTARAPVLRRAHWTRGAEEELRRFEGALVREVRAAGWDGSEAPDRLQWTFTGALFYSIVVITTIGYGHIAPKTQSGKVATVLYAILGIPLMLLCLSNIGDVMASSFRFLYWRACCYVCTRPPPPPRTHSRRESRRRARPGTLQRAHSDTDCRYRDSGYTSARPSRASRAPAAAPRAPRARTQPPAARRWDDELSDVERFSAPPHSHYEEDEFPKISLPLKDLQAALRDLDSYQRAPEIYEMRDIDRDNRERRHPHYTRGGSERPLRAHSAYERAPTDYDREPSWDRDVERGRRLRRLHTLDDSRGHRYYTPSPDREEWSEEERGHRSGWGSRHSDLYDYSAREELKPVPIWLCGVLVAGYVVAGAALFGRWEGWPLLDAAYFCFITLTTIGFGDFVPAQGGAGAGGTGGGSVALCSLYVLLGIALLAMSFNLVQEQVRANVARLAARLGIIKPRDRDL